MVADGAPQKGALKIGKLVLDTTDTNIGGAGRLDFRDESLNLRLEAHPKDVSLPMFRAPVITGGTLKKPTAGIDAAASAEPRWSRSACC